jgi:hypothetical protein
MAIMTAAAIDIDNGSTHSGLRSFLWVAALTALWVILNYWQPGIQASGVPNTASRVSIHVLIALGLWLGLGRAELSPTQRRNVWLAVMIPFTLWLSAIWNMAIYGVFRPGSGPPLLPLAIFLPVLIGAPILLRSKRIGEVLDAMPASWLVALQVYRVLGAVFLVGWARGVVPGIFGLPAGIGDITTGLLALPVAIALGRGSDDGRRAAIAWNIFGLADFAIAVSIGLMIAQGVIVPSIANAGTASYPTVMIPAFAVPSSILLHVLSLRQLSRRASVAR